MTDDKSDLIASFLVAAMTTGGGPSELICASCRWETGVQGHRFPAHLAQLHAHVKAQHPDLQRLSARRIRELRTMWK